MPPATRNALLLFFGALLFHLAGTWLLPLVDRDEPRFAEASREMIERGDYVVPYFNNHYRFDKPPLSYWAQVASYRVFGENEFGARFPSALAAALTALAVFSWGRRLNLARAGFWAAVFFSFCAQTFMMAKAATADMWLVLFVTLAHWAGFELLRDRLEARWCKPSAVPDELRGWWWMFYFSLAFAFLAKGPIGWAPLATVALMQLFHPIPQLARRFLFVRGVLLMLALIALWGVPALVRTQGEFFSVGIGKHVIGRSLGAMEGHGSNSFLLALAMLPFYFLTVFLSFAPWSVRLPWLARRLWRERDAFDCYLIAGTLFIFVVFSLVRTKLPHYTLPAFPLLAFLLARHWVDRGATDRQLRRWSFGACILWLAIALVGFPLAAPYFPARALYKQAAPYLQSSMDFAATGFEEPSLVWVFRKTVRGFDRGPLPPEKLRDFLVSPGVHFIVLPAHLADSLYPTLPSGYRKFSTRGFNVAKGRWIDVALIVKNR